MRAKQVIDLDGDGDLELLATVITGFEGYPRGLYCFDIETESLIWTYHIGPIPGHVACPDLDGDGIPEILLTGDAANNEVTGPDGTSDTHSWVYALAPDGSPIWRRQVGPWYTYPQLEFQDREDGTAEILVLAHGEYKVREARGAEAYGEVWLLDSSGATLAQYDAEDTVYTWASLGSGEDAFWLLLDRRGRLHQLNRNFQLIRRAQVFEQRFNALRSNLVGVTDMDGDGVEEMIVVVAQEQLLSEVNTGSSKAPSTSAHNHDVRVVALNRDLEIIADTLIEDKVESGYAPKGYVLERPGSLQSLVVLMNNVRRYRWEE